MQKVEEVDIFASCIMLPASHESLKNTGGNINLLFLDGTSGLVNDPYVNIIWIHIVDSNNNSQLVGQLLVNGKSEKHYKLGLELWKGLILGNGHQDELKDQIYGTWGDYPTEPPISKLEVTSTMTDKEIAMLNALKSEIGPIHNVLCRFHVLQAMNKKVLFDDFLFDFLY